MTIRKCCDGNCGNCPYGTCPSEESDKDDDQNEEE